MATEHGMSETPTGPRVHDVGPGGTVEVRVEADDVRIRGVDGTEARVVSPADGAGIETFAEPGRFTIRTGRGTESRGLIGIKLGSRSFGIPFGFHSVGTVEVEVPRDARVTVATTAGDVAVRDVRGGISARTTAGDLSVKQAGGTVNLEVASGDVHVHAAEPIELEVRSVSGDVRVRAPRFERVAVETMSGDVELAGAFARGIDHAVSTVAGDVEVALVGGLSLLAKTVSGDISCDHPDRRSGDGRRAPLVVGDGAARLTVRSMSGDVEVRRGRSGGPAEEATAPDEASTARSGTSFPAPPRPPAPPAPPGLPPLPGRAPAVADAAGPDLATLEALARGEIDVAEAERRLAARPGDAPPVGSRPSAVAEEPSRG